MKPMPVLPGVPISVSHQVSPEMREYERVSTTCANAYLQPVVSDYLLRLQRQLADGGLARPVLLMLSSGSLTTVETAARFPIRLLESGPAGGAIFAGDLARRLGLDRVLSFDMGGTTAKFCLIDHGEARRSRSFEVGRTYRFKKGSGLPIRAPVVDLVEIGAGGGSVARIDAIGRITVGPDSTGSEPGPACYGRGGRAPTVTDCDLAQGKLDAATFAGGTMPLDANAARDAIRDGFAESAGLSVENAAYAVAETVTESMAAAARVHAAEIGTPLEDRTLIAFGGGAPLHAARFAQKLGIARVMSPAGAGGGSAIGCLRAPLAFVGVRTVRRVLPGGDVAPVRRALRDMESEARAIVASAGAEAEVAVSRSVYMRYVGQGHEIEVAVDNAIDDPDASGFGGAQYALFSAAYERIYGQPIAGAPVEVTAWTVRVAQPTSAADGQSSGDGPALAEQSQVRRVYDGNAEAWRDWLVIDRDRFAPGRRRQGPLVIAEAETTTIVPEGFTAEMKADGTIELTWEARV